MIVLKWCVKYCVKKLEIVEKKFGYFKDEK